MEYIRTATREFECGSNLALEYEGGSGNLVVEGGDLERATVQIVAHIQEESAAAADDAFRRITEGVRYGDGVLTIDAAAVRTVAVATPWFAINRGLRVDYMLTVPRATRGRLGGRSGRIEVAGVHGPLDAVQRSGRFKARGIEAAVQVESRSGGVELEEIGGPLRVRSHSGRVIVRGVRESAQIQSESGAVRVEQAGANLAVQTTSGRIDAVDVAGDASIGSTSGRILLAGGEGNARLRANSGAVTFQGKVLGSVEIGANSGSISLEVEPRPPFFLDAETVSGSIRSEFTPREGGPPPEDAPTVRLRTTSGAIRIGPPRGFDMDIDINLNPLQIRFGRGGRHDLRQEMREARRAAREAEREARRAERETRRAERGAGREADDEEDEDGGRLL